MYFNVLLLYVNKTIANGFESFYCVVSNVGVKIAQIAWWLCKAKKIDCCCCCFGFRIKQKRKKKQENWCDSDTL